MLGQHTIKTWSTTQSSVPLSSGEAEFNGVVRGAGMGLGFQSLMRDLGQDAPVRVWVDSEAAIGISSRQGLGTAPPGHAPLVDPACRPQRQGRPEEGPW